MLTSLLLLGHLLIVPSHAETTFKTEGFLMAMPAGVGTGGGASIEGNAFLNLEARGFAPGVSTVRATGGIDIFGDTNDNWDLTLGLFMGGYGDWDEQKLYVAPAAGFELGLAGGVGPLKLRWRHVRGGTGMTTLVCGCSRELCSFSENELRLTFKVVDEVRVFGQVTDLTPNLEDDDRMAAYALGASVTF